MKRIILTTILSGMLSAVFADGILSHKESAARLLERKRQVVLSRTLADGVTPLRMSNVEGGGYVLTLGNQLLGYSDSGTFSTATAAPALLDLIENLAKMEVSPTFTLEEKDFSPAEEVAPILEDIQWNQDSPYNDQCPMYDLSTRCPTGCVATAMAQLMRYHRWPLQGSGEHSYQPVIMGGNTLSANFGQTTYQWDAMLPNYANATEPAPGYTMDECREAVARLMLHCGVAVDMVYYQQSGATDYDVPHALTTYFGYDRSMAYRKREHYGTADWLQLLCDEFKAGRPVLAYGRSASGGHAYVFDGMDANGFIHVNWGWGGMNNGYFNTSALTPASQGIGGSDGGFNYSQRIITGIMPADGMERDYDVELTSTEGLAAGKTKIGQGGEVVIRLTGKVANHGWREAEFDYALLLLSERGDTVHIVAGPTAQQLAKDATAYAPSFGNVSLGTLSPGRYVLYPACRTTGGTGRWLRIRDNYIGYVNRLDVVATETDITFSQPDYFELKATDTEVPETVYSGVPALITTKVSNQGDVEYHGEVKAQLRRGTSIVATTSNYIVDLQPGDTISLRFTDSFTADAGSYTLCLVDDDGRIISSRYDITVKPAPTAGNVVAATPLTIVKSQPDEMQATVSVKTEGGFFGGLVYVFIFREGRHREESCLFPQYVMLDSEGSTRQLTLTGSFENGIPGATYYAQVAVYDGKQYTFLNDNNATCPFVFAKDASGIGGLKACPESADDEKAFDLAGRPADEHSRGIWLKKGKKMLKH